MKYSDITNEVISELLAEMNEAQETIMNSLAKGSDCWKVNLYSDGMFHTCIWNGTSSKGYSSISIQGLVEEVLNAHSAKSRVDDLLAKRALIELELDEIGE